MKAKIFLYCNACGLISHDGAGGSWENDCCEANAVALVPRGAELSQALKRDPDHPDVLSHMEALAELEAIRRLVEMDADVVLGWGEGESHINPDTLAGRVGLLLHDFIDVLEALQMDPPKPGSFETAAGWESYTKGAHTRVASLMKAMIEQRSVLRASQRAQKLAESDSADLRHELEVRTRDMDQRIRQLTQELHPYRQMEGGDLTKHLRAEIAAWREKAFDATEALATFEDASTLTHLQAQNLRLREERRKLEAELLAERGLSEHDWALTKGTELGKNTKFYCQRCGHCAKSPSRGIYDPCKGKVEDAQFLLNVGAAMTPAEIEATFDSKENPHA